MDGSDIWIWVLFVIGLLGLLGIILWLSFLTQNKDNATEIRKILAIVAGVNGIMVTIFGVAAYVYFSANTMYLTPFLLIVTFLNMFLSLFAISSSALQVVRT